jgi:alanine-glyoxylate transaminase/serine-glyoxylate transaminase/serine-pyruvate transaminase
VIDGLKYVFRTAQEVVVYPGSGTGAWEAALVNVLSPGDLAVSVETGQFAHEWTEVARRFGLRTEIVPTDWRRGADPALVEERLVADRGHEVKAIMIVHNETSTGAASRIGEIRKAMDRAGHPALLLVDTISSLGSLDYRHDEWGVDVSVGASQKGLMLPAGLALNAISPKAIEASKGAKLPKSYWQWDRMLARNEEGFFPYTPATNLLYGLREALRMIREEGLEELYHRHARFGAATRAAVEAWGLEIQCVVPSEQSNVLTGVRLPDGHDADQVRGVILDRFSMSLGMGLARLKGKVFRIGHLGDFNDLMLLATLAGVESGLALSGVPIRRGGVDAARL